MWSLASITMAAAVLSMAPPAGATSLPPVNGELTGVASISPTDAWAVGWRQDGDDGDLSLFEHWDGNGWSVVPGAHDETEYPILRDVSAVSSTDVWAVGSDAGGPIAEQWDGDAWRMTRPPAPTPGYASQLLSVSARAWNDVWAVGWFLPRDTVHALIEHWDGNTWSRVRAASAPRADQGLSGIVAIAPDDAWAVGSSRAIGTSKTGDLVEHWDGASWTIVADAGGHVGYNWLNSVAAAGPSNVWAVGSSGSDFGTFVERWDGSDWRSVPLSSATRRTADIVDVSVVSGDDVWAAGSNEDGGVIEHWDGDRWGVAATLALPVRGGGFSAIATGPGPAWAVGSVYDFVGELLIPEVARQQRDRWHLLGAQAPIIHRASLRVTTSGRTAHVGDRVSFEVHATNVENRQTNLWINYVNPEGFDLRREICVDGPSADTPSCEFSYVPAHDRVAVKVTGRVTGSPGMDASVTFCAILIDKPTTSCKTGRISIVP
jgi:hypothetical protein